MKLGPISLPEIDLRLWCTLVYRNLRHDQTRFLTAIFGVAFAALLAAFEGGLLVGFSHAASRTVDAIDAEVWILRKGTRSFDLGFGLEQRVKHLVRGVPQVQSAGEVVVGWTSFVGPKGEPTSVQVVGIGEELAHRIRRTGRSAEHPSVDLFFVDATYLNSLGLEQGSRAEIGGRQVFLGAALDGYASFMGTPFVLSDLATARSILTYPSQLTSFVAIKLIPGASETEAITALQARFPELEILSKNEFSWRSRIYWLLQTGAGAALVLCTLLGFAVGLAIVSQTIYAITMDRLDEYATLKAMGAPQQTIRKMVYLQAMVCTAIGAVVGLVAVHGVVVLANLLIGWCEQPLWMAFVVASLLLPMSLVAARLAAKPALHLEPARAFRA